MNSVLASTFWILIQNAVRHLGELRPCVCCSNSSSRSCQVNSRCDLTYAEVLMQENRFRFAPVPHRFTLVCGVAAPRPGAPDSEMEIHRNRARISVRKTDCRCWRFPLLRNYGPNLRSSGFPRKDVNIFDRKFLSRRVGAAEQ